jgi:arylsulfatase
MCIVSWPKGIAARGEVRDQYVHAVDVVPTLYDLLGIEPPAEIGGAVQSPIEGESFAASLTDPGAPGKETQFFSMLGQRAVYHQGWLANTLHPPISGWGKFDDDEWELYHLAEDRAQARNVAAEHPDRLEELKRLWHELAEQVNGMPLDDRTALEIISTPKPQPGVPRDRYVYYPDTAEVPESVAVNVRGRSFTIAAGVSLDTPEAEGVLFAHGGVGGGHVLYVKDRRLHYLYNWLGEQLQLVSSEDELEPGRHVLTAEFQKTGNDQRTASATGTLTLYVDDEPAGSIEVMTQPGFFALCGDGLCVGRDSGSPVSREYAAPFAFAGGTIERVVVDVSGDAYVDHEKEVLAWLARD